MPSISFSRTSSAMRSTRVARFTLYGISVMTICSIPPLSLFGVGLAAHADDALAGGEVGLRCRRGR